MSNTLPNPFTGDPTVGQFYRVPCVYSAYECWLPVIGTRHKDPEVAPSVPWDHYHYDWRFINDALVRSLFHRDPSDPLDMPFCMAHVHWLNQPGARLKSAPGYSDPEAIRMLRRRCARVMPTFPVHGDNTLTRRVEDLCAGKTFDPAHPVCPHRGFSLVGLPVDEEGCVVCPGHGLRLCLRTGTIVSRYDAATGEALPPREIQASHGGCS